ncbi:MAG: methyltransferase domain-containing protein [Gammaproteobacteria bacterium]|nr:methyltransferase domain-containing protein [Gammaproteobacteria bacterium]
MIHFAPEKCLRQCFAEYPAIEYIPVDLKNPNARVYTDITHMSFADNSVDIAFCSHVLEHVSDDRQAIREIYRVLRADGRAFILVPVGPHPTYEDPAVVEPEERERLFGQPDHLRMYGMDIQDRLGTAGFEVEVYHLSQIASDRETRLMKLDCPGCREIFVCRKPSQAEASTGGSRSRAGPHV